MTLTWLYTIIVLCATTIGVITGLGGGVIIKPLFDLLGADTATVIGFYSSVAVFTMCLVSIYKQPINNSSKALILNLIFLSGYLLVR